MKEVPTRKKKHFWQLIPNKNSTFARFLGFFKKTGKV